LHAFFRDLFFVLRLFSFLFFTGPPVVYAHDLSRGVCLCWFVRIITMHQISSLGPVLGIARSSEYTHLIT
jgi:ABC-type polysaccharide/polyol phosphate export permease